MAEFYAVADIEIIKDRFLYIISNYKFEEGEAKERQRKAGLFLCHLHDVCTYLYIKIYILMSFS